MNTNKLRHFLLLSEVFFWIFQFSFSGWETSGFFSSIEKREEVDNVAPISHLIYSCTIASQVTIITCLDSQSRQLSHDALPPPVLFGVWGRRSQAQLRQGALSPPLFTDAHQNGHEKCLPQVDASLQKAHFLEAKPKSLHLKSMLPKITASLSSLSFHKNNVQMSLVEINKTQEFLISLE